MSSPRTLLVTGATGKQGGAVVQALLARLASTKSESFRIIGLTRNKTSESAKALQSTGKVAIVEGDLDDCSALFRSIEKEHNTRVWGVFSVQIPNVKSIFTGPDVEGEERQGKALVDAAIAHGVQKFVYASVDRGGLERSDRDPTNVPHFASKFRIEEHLKKRCSEQGVGMHYSILRTVAFMENLIEPQFGTAFAKIWQGFGDHPMQVIGVADIGTFAAKAMIDEPFLRDQALSIAGDQLTFKQANEIFREVMAGQDTPKSNALVPWLARRIISDVDLMFKWLEANVAGADIERCRKMEPGMRNLRDWLSENKKHWA